SGEPPAETVLRFADPDGNPVLLHTPMPVTPPLTVAASVRGPDTPVHPLGVDHVVVGGTDLDAAERFYGRVLGMRVADRSRGLMTFLRCNRNHHALAVKLGATGLEHIAFTVGGWDDIARGIYRLGERGAARVWGPGRHGPGNNLFVYFADPDGNVV